MPEQREQPLRVAVVGLGFMGAKHMAAFEAASNAEVVAVYSRDEKKLSGDLSGIQGNLGGPGGVYDFSKVKKYSDLDALLQDQAIDAVDICLPTNLHADVTVRALEAGKDALVEKPMALDFESSQRMIAAAEANARILMAAHVLRFFPEYRALFDFVESGTAGTVRAASFRRRCAAPAWSGWLSDPAKSGGGVFDLLIHDVDACLRVFGMPTLVSAEGYEDLASGIDVISARLAYPEGLSVEIAGGWHHPKSFPFSMEYTVVADAGTLDFRHETRPPTLYKADGSEQACALEGQDGYQAEIAYFLKCCETREAPVLCQPADSAKAVGLTNLLLQSRREHGRQVLCEV